jgi:hypothetical protein
VKNKTPKNKFEQYLALQSAATTELLEERKALQSQLRAEVSKFEKILAENAERLAKLGHKVKETGVVAVGRNIRLPDDQIKERLQTILAGKRKLSIPVLLKELRIARTRFSAFLAKNKGFLASEGGGRSTVYFLKNPKA